MLISKMFLIRVLSFIWDFRFNVRGEHVPGGCGREDGLGGYQPGVYVPLKALFLVRSVCFSQIVNNSPSLLIESSLDENCVLCHSAPQLTKTCPCNMQRFSIVKLGYFNIFAPNIDCGYLGEAILTRTHNLCF